MKRKLPATIALLCLCATPVLASRIDEYLQATIVGVLALFVSAGLTVLSRQP